MISVGGPQSTTAASEMPESTGPAMALPSLAELRRGDEAGRSTVLDKVLYGQFDEGREPAPVRDVRRDIVDTSVVLVRSAARRQPRILAGPASPHGTDPAGGDWPQRFARMLDRVSPCDNGVAATADVVAQCAEISVALSKLVAVMSQTVTERLINDGRPRDELYRKHMRNAARYADIAWCASHGELAQCPSWRSERREHTEQQVLAELRRHLPADVGDLAGVPDPRGEDDSGPRAAGKADDPTDRHWATVVRDGSQ
ncbi:MAG: hypothetical protein ACRD0P_09390 [Stackebrandtia sp.]